MARALVNDPKILLLDEPTLGFDPQGQHEMLQIIKAAVRENRTAVLLSSHLLGVVEEICPRVLILNRGHLVAAETVSDVKRHVSPPQSCWIRVSPAFLAKTVTALRSLEFVHALPYPDRPGELLITFQEKEYESALKETLRNLIAADIPINAFGREAARLSDAFLSMVREGH